MLGKMIKHEFKATGRLYLPLYALVLVLTPLLALLFKAASSIGDNSMVGGLLAGISMFGYVILMIALCIGTFLFLVMRFYRTVATSEAYLTFCLPVSRNHILGSKVLVGVIWQVISYVVAILSVYGMLIIQGAIRPGDILDKIRKYMPLISQKIGVDSVFVLLLYIGLIVLITTISGLLSFYLAICLGQLFNEHRVIASIGMYVAIYTVTQIITMVIFMPMILEEYKPAIVGQVKVVDAETAIAQMPSVKVFVTMGIIQLCLAVVYYIASSIILKKKTNVR